MWENKAWILWLRSEYFLKPFEEHPFKHIRVIRGQIRNIANMPYIFLKGHGIAFDVGLDHWMNI